MVFSSIILQHKLPFPTLLLCQRDHNFNNMIKDLYNERKLLDPGSHEFLAIQDNLLTYLLVRNFDKASCRELKIAGTEWLGPVQEALAVCDQEYRNETIPLSSGKLGVLKLCARPYL